MEPEFWHERWQHNQIGFHESSVHALLTRHWPRVAGASTGEVLVPLCGKSVDLHWLAERGHTVIGSELSELAVGDFLAQKDVEVTTHGALKRHLAGPYRLWCGDFFALGDGHEPPLGLAYDRAALVALPDAMRRRYATHLMSRLAPGGNLLLITLHYSESELTGPPFSVSHAEIERLFGASCQIEQLEQSPARVKGRFEVTETASWLKKRED